MQIDPSQVQWDAPANTGPIDASKVNWNTPQGSYSPPDMNAPLRNSPLAPGGVLHNLLTGEIEAGNSMRTGLMERYYQLTGNHPALSALQSQVGSDRQLFAPANETTGAKVGNFMGQAAPAAAAALIPGLQGYAGTALIGGLQGAAQPTTEGESPLLNTLVGGLSAPVAKFGGDLIGGALTRSLVSRGSNRALAAAVGSDASALADTAIGERAGQVSDIYRAVRTPSVAARLDPSLVESVSNGLDASTRQAFEANPNVNDLLGHVTGAGQASAQQLGDISTGLRQDAYSALNTEGGSRPLGRALQGLRNKVEDSIQSTISDPQLAASYQALRGQYGLFQDVKSNPTLLNPVTGRAKMLNIANYLNRNFDDYAEGTNSSPLYLAAKLAQGASDEGKTLPKFELTNLGIPWLFSRIGQNFGEQGARTATTAAALAPLSGGLRAGLPVAGALRYGLPSLTLGAQGTLLPYLSQ